MGLNLPVLVARSFHCLHGAAIPTTPGRVFPRLCSQAAAMPKFSKGWASAAASPAPASPSLPVLVVDSLSSSTSSDDEGSSDSQSEVEPFPPGPFEDEDTDNNSEFSVFEMVVETIAGIAAASSSSTLKKLKHKRTGGKGQGMECGRRGRFAFGVGAGVVSAWAS